MKKKALYKKWMSMLLAGVVTTTGFMGGTVTLRAAETTNWIGDEGLSGTADAPKPDDVVPDANQFRYQKEELAAFCHFGPNTFNEIEWGEHYGNKAPSEIFTLKNDFDAETLVKTLKDAGFKKLIVTAKHHDGFCIWDSKYTDYDVKESGYKDKNGESDILAEISKACTDQNMDMGLYLSPWDIHEPSYGYKDENGQPTTPENDKKDYNEFYNNQLEEILGNPKYGNNGKFVEVWMDGAKGSGANAQEYNFQKWFDTIQKYEGKGVDGRDADCMLFGAEAYTTVRWIGNELGIAGKDTWSKSKVDKNANTINSNKQGNATVGFEDGNQWTVPEADARITSGWFWGTQKNTPKTMEELSDMYFNSVGHNATLLLNVPPNNQGTVDEAILKRVEEFGKNVKESFDENLAKAEGASVKVSSVRGNAQTYKPSNMIDENDDTYWTTDDGTKSGEILIDLGKETKFDVVSVEEAIQNGQRINNYKVEYRNGDSGAWTLLEEGKTIGAKRLCRTSETTARQIKITVGTTDGKVPMISEVGVYKTTEGMEKANPIPKGMEVIDVTDKNVEDGKGFTFKGTWHDENQPQYINGTNTWANKDAEFELKFHGTKAYLFGTVDPGHGTVEITVDDGKPVTVDTKASKRAVGQKWFETPDLEDGDHTIKLKVTGKAAGIEAAAVINNGGKGMIELESDSYTMNEDETKSLKVKRVGGTKGKITAKLQPNPGTAIQDDYDTTLIPEIVLEEGQTETTADVKTRRNKNKTGDQYFTAEITDVSEGAILGFNKKAKINIKDMESSEGSLAALVKECESYKKDWFTSGWDEFDSALKQAKIVLEDKNATPEKRNEAETALKKAKDGLVKREKYTAEDPFVFPWREKANATLEAEFAELHNTGAADEKWKLSVSDGDWASNKKFINCLNGDDTIAIPYKVEKPGTYHVKLTYRSGSADNSLAWKDDAGNIKAGSVVAGNTNANETKTVDFDIVATKAGSGILTLEGDTKDAPQLDMFEITPGDDIQRAEFTVNASVEGDGGTITPDGATTVTEGNDVTFKITPDKTHKVADVLVNGESVGAVTSYTLKDVKENATVVAKFAPAAYTEENRFNFPTEVNGTAITAEAEHFALKNVGTGEAWPLQVSAADWASNGYFVNAMNSGDQITLHYHAEKPGKYKATVQFRSGDTNNGLTWSEADNKIAAQTEVMKIGAGDQAKATHTQDIEFVVNEAGDGTLVFTAPEKNAPQLDKFDITLVEEKAPVVVNKDALKAAIDAAKEALKEEDKYTEESVKALKDAVAEAEKVAADENATQESVDAATKAVEEATKGLAEKPAVPEADKTALKAVLADAAQKLAGADAYTEESVKALKDAVDLAQNVFDNSDASQTEVDAAVTAVRDAIEKLQEKPPVQKEFTITAVAHGGGTIDPSGAVKVEEGKDQVFTIQPYEGFEVKEVFVNGESVGAVTEYKFEAVRADASIEVFFAEKEAVQADKTKLNESIAAAEELLKHAEDYVPEDVQNLMEVLDAAKAVAADPAATQETVDAAQNALDAAMNIAPIQKEFAIMAAAGEGGSITPCGTVKVERGMSQTFVIQPEEGYVISDVLVNGQSVGAVAEYTFCDVNADANITALFQKAAVSTDKSQLTAVIKEAEERLEQADKYTEETVKALQKEVEAAQFILADKEASQKEIDAAVQKVRTAIDALEEKTQTEKPENPDNNKPDNNKPGNGNNDGQNNGNNSQSTTQKPSTGTPNKAVKTGDATPIAGAVSGLLAGGAALLAFLKRRK
ncbi:alpha-L-fucosidase [[Ruminococcus] gnavus]|uniref:alpha-L-fucosidase n=1 Tax=Mediterraneibacter gnavus TaxID=33038 RepID=A0AB35J366_MEDGN|nr:alpha-L-fucosidase [Mediterraneibacter gnavus]MDB8726165.1 alpha-L-fucosidase [Mediterraneibacter gnavus]MDB8728119.1 alpha-L-fucosidase [Mediterraneibacter gnavus]MDB8732319.1 alpha-L-fucosidase [Mediterraneibacter gnavus]MDB8738737.1 alpha-L-fucosidase [Mediterraneibacter gnavus]